MPVQVKGGIELRKALKKYTPDLAKEMQKEMASLLKPITAKARGFIPSDAPLSGWGKASPDAKWYWNGRAAKKGANLVHLLVRYLRALLENLEHQ
jgi:hypothetical protein